MADAYQPVDYSTQLDQMLAPYREQAAKLTSPYATMRPDSWLATQHPKVAGVLDNAFLTGAMTPGPQGPEGFGGGLSRTFQGLLGANQYRRQQTMMQAMLPYQMLEPRLKAEDTLAQMDLRQKQARYDMQRGEWYEKRITSMDNPHAIQGVKTDDKGGEWQEIFDPVHGTSRLFNPVLQKHADELPAEQQPSFEKSLRQNRMSTPGGLMGEIIDMRMSADPLIKARGESMADMYTKMYGGVAGARTGGEQGAPHPYSESKDFLTNERNRAFQTMPKMMSQKEYEDTHLIDPEYWAKRTDAKGNVVSGDKVYQDYVQGEQTKRQKLDSDLAQYEKSGAYKSGRSFNEWQQSQSAPATAGGDTSPNWTPK